MASDRGILKACTYDALNNEQHQAHLFSSKLLACIGQYAMTDDMSKRLYDTRIVIGSYHDPHFVTIRNL